jgi:predicted acyl esterase
MAIVLPDGCRLSARVFMPKDAGPNATKAQLLKLAKVIKASQKRKKL